MPILYPSITEEHQAVCQHCSVFDISHMGEVYITGAGTEWYANRIFVSDVAGAPINQVFYGMVLYPDGGTVGDLLVCRMGGNKLFLVFNAANISKDVVWMRESAEGLDVTIDYYSDYYG